MHWIYLSAQTFQETISTWGMYSSLNCKTVTSQAYPTREAIPGSSNEFVFHLKEKANGSKQTWWVSCIYSQLFRIHFRRKERADSNCGVVVDLEKQMLILSKWWPLFTIWTSVPDTLVLFLSSSTSERNLNTNFSWNTMFLLNPTLFYLLIITIRFCSDLVNW